MLFVSSAAVIGAADRPLKLKGTSVVNGDPFAEEGAPFITVGTGTHLGKFKGTGTVFFTLQDDGMIFGEGTVTFTAANGRDKIATTFEGILDPESGEAEIEFDIIGGTNRFEDADGGFDAVAQTAAPGTFTFTADGTISY
jgi:hypothetical protein